MKSTARTFAIAAAAAVALCMPTVASPALAGADTVPSSADLDRMGPPPEGVNDWHCQPTAAHPRPVVLLHGTGSSMQQAFPVLAPQLKKDGYCVYALNYGGIPTWYDSHRIVWGVSDIRHSAFEVGVFVNAILRQTGAVQVDIVGHSQGGVVARQYLEFGDSTQAGVPGGRKVRSLVALGPTNHGTTFNGQQQLYSTLAQTGLNPDVIDWVIFGIAGRQQLVGSKLINDLNGSGETVPGVSYTVIAAKDDEVVTPPEGSFLRSDSPDVHNVWAQDGCPGPVGHSGLMLQPHPLWLVQSALDPSFAKNKPAPCP